MRGHFYKFFIFLTIKIIDWEDKNNWTCIFGFFNWLFLVALTARFYFDCHFFPFWEWYFSSHTWDFSVSMVDIYQAVSKYSSGHVRRKQPRDQTTPSNTADSYRVVSKVVSRPRPTWTTMRSGNPIYELLYEFRLHCYLLGILYSINPPFWEQWFQISRNIKH